MSYINILKKFVFDGLLLADSFQSLESEGISIGLGGDFTQVERIQESDFSPKIIFNAKNMASIYIVFFCLENSVRELIDERLTERYKIDWWNEKVPAKIRENVKKLKAKEEKNKYHANRSMSLIGYTLFGDLTSIIVNNWEDFSDLFPSQDWINSRFTDLEMSRNIIMHTGVLPMIEIDRIESIARDWIRQVG